MHEDANSRAEHGAGESCPRCGAPRVPSDTTCRQCRWIFEDPDVARTEVAGYPGERIWRGFCGLMQAMGVVLLFYAFYPGRPRGLRGVDLTPAIVSLIFLVGGWGLRRKGPSGSILAALGAFALLMAAASAKHGLPGAFQAGMIASIPFALTAFAAEIGEAMGYIRIRGAAPGEISGRILAGVGWAGYVGVGWLLMRAA